MIYKDDDDDDDDGTFSDFSVAVTCSSTDVGAASVVSDAPTGTLPSEASSSTIPPCRSFCHGQTCSGDRQASPLSATLSVFERLRVDQCDSQARRAIPQQERANKPETKEYKPPSPIAFWMGMATCERIQPNEPRMKELQATADAERP